jgi:NAD+ synthase (glutamine-hydrolysing)
MAVLYVNQTGGQDELVFDGQSFAMDNRGTICAQASAFEEELLEVRVQGTELIGTMTPPLKEEALIYKALVCGTRDYVLKNHFPGVVLGLSGGIDSALTLCLAVDALGANKVHALIMPSRFSANMSQEDAVEQAKRMNVSYSILPIEPLFASFLSVLSPVFQGLPQDTTEENLQARIRGMLLMAYSNKTGTMVLTTSNKSETAVGYATLYGDMAGGYAVLKDVLKTQVYALANYRNTVSKVIPQRVITRAPSAELKPNQTDQDHLPEYAVLDRIIHGYMVDTLSKKELTEQGLAPEDVQRVIGLIKHNEYKRRQAAPGVKISPVAFGKDWRYPLSHDFYEA